MFFPNKKYGKNFTFYHFALHLHNDVKKTFNIHELQSNTFKA